MLPSGNDAAFALAEYFGKLVGCSFECFIDLMNKESREIGLLNTWYGNPHGLTAKKNLSSARDVCVLASLALKD